MSGVFFSEDFYSWLPYHKLCELYEKSEDYYNAICTAEQLLKFENVPAERKKEVEGRILHWYDCMLDECPVEVGLDERRNVLIVDKTGQFTRELKKRLSRKYNVILVDFFSPQHCKWADAIWFDWCDENLVCASQVRWQAGVVAMLRSHEHFTKYPREVNWRNVDRVLFVSERMKRVSLKKFPSMRQAGPEVLRDGVDLSSLSFRERDRGKNIAWTGFLNHKKNVPLLLELAVQNRDFEFHVAGSFQDERLENYVKHYMGANSLGNVVLHGWIEDIDIFLEGMNYVLSTSLWEGTHLSVLEGMAKGLKPLVHFWPGASEHYRAEWLFRNSREFRQLLHNGRYESAAYRKHVEDNFSMEARLAKAEEIIASHISKEGGADNGQLQQ
jgi:glycosyltransferase involved in cell wall biosynthesis